VYEVCVWFSRVILGYTLFEYLELRLACFIHKIGLVGAPSYLSSLLVLGRSSSVYAVIQISIGVYVFGM
jgi:hypothetical protein